MNRRLTFLAGALTVVLAASCSRDASPASPTAAIGGAGVIATATAAPASATTGSSAGGSPPLSVGVARQAAPESVATISLADAGTTSDDPSVRVDGSTVTITGSGAFALRGTLTAGRVIVNSAGDDPVWLILDGVDITNPTGAAIAVMDASAAVVVLADGTENRLTDGAVYTFDDPAADEPNATLFSKADLTIEGTGSLTVDAAYNDGIASKDALAVRAGNLTIDAADDGIRGRDSLAIEGGTIAVRAGGDGLTSDNDEDPERGTIAIAGGTLDITSAGDAIQARTTVHVADGQLTLRAGGGSRARLAADVSAKGVKGGAGVVIDGGTFDIDAADDAIHANGAVTIDGGSFTLATGDDAIHADATLEVNGGAIDITASYEGIESAVITINDGDIRLVSSDDGINVAGGNDGASQQQPPMRGGAPGGVVAASGTYLLTINGGRIVVYATGDGIDANGAIVMTGGVVLVHGPTAAFNAALDYDRSFQLSGGTFVAAGSARMAQRPGTGSTQASVSVRFPTAQPGGTLVQVRSADGRVLLAFAPSKAYESLVFSSPALAGGAAYEVFVGGAPAGEEVGGLYREASGGTRVASISAS
jgi:hypothetical protein